MSIANSKTFADVPDCFIRPTERCFFCGEPLTGNVWVFWNGIDEHNQQIWLHPTCANKLASALQQDFKDYASKNAR